MERRANNFSSSEKNLLINLVLKHKNTLECKKSGVDINNLKKKTWMVVEREFNSQSGDTHRSANVLMNKYKNLKKRSKKKFADEKAYIYGTGGGPADDPLDVTEADIAFKEILGSQLTGTVSIYDDDAVTEESNTENKKLILPLSSEEEEESPLTPSISAPTPQSLQQENEKVVEAQSQHNDWRNYTPQLLKSQTAAPLQTHTRGPKNKITKELTSWVDSKRDSNRLRDKLMMEEHHLKMTFIKEKHEQEMKFAAEEHALRIKIMQKNLEILNK